MYSKWGGSVLLASNATRIGDLNWSWLLAAELTDSSCGVTQQIRENEGVAVQNYCPEFWDFCPEFVSGPGTVQERSGTDTRTVLKNTENSSVTFLADKKSLDHDGPGTVRDKKDKNQDINEDNNSDTQFVNINITCSPCVFEP